MPIEALILVASLIRILVLVARISRTLKVHMQFIAHVFSVPWFLAVVTHRPSLLISTVIVIVGRIVGSIGVRPRASDI